MRKNVQKEFEYIQKALAELLDEPEDGEGYWGHISDAMFEDYGAKELLENMEIKCKK